MFELLAWIRTRRDMIVTSLISIEETATVSEVQGPVDAEWTTRELNEVLRTLEETERSEMELWRLVARLRGQDARTSRSAEWATWFQQVTSKIATLKAGTARRRSAAAEVGTESSSGSCPRRGGFLERVKLPQFSGSVEDYGEFKTQFQELCKGESYTEVIELAQLRQKLPKDALAILCGLSDLKTAWARLDESYGNTNMQVLAALKRLQNFKTSKTAAHDQVVEMATAVQRCVTVLTALSRLEDFLRDQETLAEVVSTLPSDSQQRWYHRKGARGESPREKGCSFLAWLEEERADAVAIHLDSLARRPKSTANQPPVKKPAASAGGTDQSVYTAALNNQPAPEDPTTALTQREDSGPKPPVAGRIEVTTLAQAREVALKRKANLEERKVDKCPLCKQSHEYEKTWASVVPPVKTKMLSTLLSSCPQFLALPADQKLVSVTAHAACLLCTSWEHTRHKFGGKEQGDPKCKTLVSGWSAEESTANGTTRLAAPPATSCPSPRPRSRQVRRQDCLRSIEQSLRRRTVAVVAGPS